MTGRSRPLQPETPSPPAPTASRSRRPVFTFVLAIAALAPLACSGGGSRPSSSAGAGAGRVTELASAGGSAAPVTAPAAAPASASARSGADSATNADTTDTASAAPMGRAGDEVEVRARPIEDLFILTGELSAVESLDLVSPRSEQWRLQIMWLLEDGTEVREGDRIVEFDNAPVAQTLEERRLARLQSEINLESRKASLVADGQEKTSALERARIGVERASAQAAVPVELMSSREWQEKQAALRQAEAAFEKARLEAEAFATSSKAEIENLQIARDKAVRDIEAAERTLGALSVRAPKPGIVVVAENWNEDRKYQVGDTLWPGLTVASIPDLSVMETIAYLSDVDDGRIAPEMPVRLILDTYPDRVYPGRVEEVAAVADRKGFRVRISMERSDPKIMRPGMSVRVEVVRRAWMEALTVPRQAIIRDEDKTHVMKAGAQEGTEIRIGTCTPTDCIVESGLGEGDRVLLH